MENDDFRGLDILAVASFILGYQNLIENREQSAHNDVSAANDQQAKHLLAELGRKFDEQNVMLAEILKEVKNHGTV